MSGDWFRATDGPGRVLALGLPRTGTGGGRCATDARLCDQRVAVEVIGHKSFDDIILEVRGFRMKYGRRGFELRELR